MHWCCFPWAGLGACGNRGAQLCVKNGFKKKVFMDYERPESGCPFPVCVSCVVTIATVDSSAYCLGRDALNSGKFGC